MTNSYPFVVFGDESKGKRVLVTGGTKGVGEAIVRRFELSGPRLPPARALRRLQAWLLLSLYRLIIEKGNGCQVVTEETQNGPSAIAFNLAQPTAMYDAHHRWLAALTARSEQAATK